MKTATVAAPEPLAPGCPAKRPFSEQRRDIDSLDQAIVNLAARINAATYELLVLIRQFDERAGFLRWGLPNCTQWLHWRCDLSLSAAREKIRVAHALKDLPEVSAAFASGKLSYFKATSDWLLMTDLSFTNIILNYHHPFCTCWSWFHNNHHVLYPWLNLVWSDILG